jgi:hypothetical protein
MQRSIVPGQLVEETVEALPHAPERFGLDLADFRLHATERLARCHGSEATPY